MGHCLEVSSETVFRQELLFIMACEVIYSDRDLMPNNTNVFKLNLCVTFCTIWNHSFVHKANMLYFIYAEVKLFFFEYSTVKFILNL